MKSILMHHLRAKLRVRRHRLRQRIRRLTRPAWLGTLRRTGPLSAYWGFDRGTPVDRYYIERFLEKYRGDIHGRVLEMEDSEYTKRFGVGVGQSDVLDVVPTNPLATIVADLSAADSIPSELFDCFVLTQTLQYIYDVHAAIVHAHRILRRGGALLVTVPTLGRLDDWSVDYWRFTAASCARLFEGVFGPEQVTIHTYGNTLTAIAVLAGMAVEELSPRELDTRHEQFPVIIAVRAVKPR